MGIQIRENIAWAKRHEGESVWIVGSGPGLDDIDIDKLAGKHVIAVNAAIALFSDREKHANSWWLWRDSRVWRELESRVKKFSMIKAYLHRRELEVMRSLINEGWYVDIEGEIPKPENTIIETAILTAEYFGFETAYLVGVDLRCAEDGRVYSKKLSWKPVHCSKPDYAGSELKVADKMIASLKKLPETKMKVFTTSNMNPDSPFEYIDFNEAL